MSVLPKRAMCGRWVSGSVGAASSCVVSLAACICECPALAPFQWLSEPETVNAGRAAINSSSSWQVRCEKMEWCRDAFRTPAARLHIGQCDHDGLPPMLSAADFFLDRRLRPFKRALRPDQPCPSANEASTGFDPTPDFRIYRISVANVSSV